MALSLRYGNSIDYREETNRQAIVFESRLNKLALEYGYKYRLDIQGRSGLPRIEFVPTLREARFVGMPVRRSGGHVAFFKINLDGTLKRHQW